MRPLDGVRDWGRDPRVEETRLTRDLYTLHSVLCCSDLDILDAMTRGSYSQPDSVTCLSFSAYWLLHLLNTQVPTTQPAHFFIINHATYLPVNPGWCP